MKNIRLSEKNWVMFENMSVCFINFNFEDIQLRLQ